MTSDWRPDGLRTGYAENPLGIDTDRPDLAWTATADHRNARQRAFRVLVASDRETLDADRGDVWDTGRRDSTTASTTYSGPTLDSGERYHWKVRVWNADDEASAWSEPATFETGLANDDWDASWIRRPTDGEFERGQFTYFRRSIALDGEASRARAYVSASHQYVLSVNGTRVARGQSYAYPDAHYYKVVDLTDALEAGENTLGVLHNWNGEGQGRPAAEPGLLVQLDVTFEDGTERTVVSDGEWTWRSGPWDEDAPLRNGEIVEPVEILDGRDVPLGWDEPGTDESWDAVDVVGPHPTEPWTHLNCQAREIVRHEREPVSLERLNDGTYVADFGRVYAAEPEVHFSDGEAGHRVDMRAGYLLDEDGRVETEEGAQWTDMRYAYVQRDGAQSFEAYNYLGFRYLEIEDPGEELEPDQVRIHARHNGVPDEAAATFDSTSAGVDDVWELARHSLLYGSQEQFVDTPTREKGQFLMDAFNMSWATTRAFRERNLSRQAIREFLDSHYRYWAAEGRFNAVYPNGDGKRDIPDFTENFGEWLWQFYRVSGDREILEEAYPALKAAADYVARHVDEESGLVTNLSGGVGGPYEEGIVDWPPEMRYGYDREWPARTTVNVLGANTFRRAADVADALDRPYNEVEHYRARHEALADAIDAHFRDADGLYVDGADGTGGRSAHASQHANAFPLAFGLVPEEDVDTVADYVVEQGVRMGPMMAIWLLRALERADRYDALVDVLTDPSTDGWANILEQGGTFTWETWHARDPDLPTDERRNRSQSHAMGATVLVAIQEALLGVRIHSPGDVDIVLPSGGLDAAEGRVPTENGDVVVSWSRDPERTLDATIPWNTTATVTLPDAADTTVYESEAGVWADGAPAETLPDGVRDVSRADDDLHVEVGSGTYTFTARGE